VRGVEYYIYKCELASHRGYGRIGINHGSHLVEYAVLGGLGLVERVRGRRNSGLRGMATHTPITLNFFQKFLFAIRELRIISQNFSGELGGCSPTIRSTLLVRMLKTCAGPCGEEKHVDEFYARAASPDGLQPACKACDNRRTNRSKKKRRNTWEGHAHQLIVSARSRRTHGRCTITEKWILNKLEEQGYACARSGQKFTLDPVEGCRIKPFAPSLDRIDCTKGYQDGNVQVTCAIYNIARQDNPIDVFEEFCMTLARNRMAA